MGESMSWDQGVNDAEVDDAEQLEARIVSDASFVS